MESWWYNTVCPVLKGLSEIKWTKWLAGVVEWIRFGDVWLENWTSNDKPVLVPPLQKSYLTLFPVDHACCPAGLATPAQTWSVQAGCQIERTPGIHIQPEWINYTNNALVLHYLLCFQTPYRCNSGLLVQSVGHWCWGWRNLPPSPAGNAPFAILHYVGPPFCNASDSNISGSVCQLNAGRCRCFTPQYRSTKYISLFSTSVPWLLWPQSRLHRFLRPTASADLDSKRFERFISAAGNRSDFKDPQPSRS